MKTLTRFLSIFVFALPHAAVPREGQGATDSGAEERPLVLNDGTQLDASLVGWDAEGARWMFRSQRDGRVSVPLDQLVRFGAHRAGASAAGVLLVDGSLLIGRISQLDAERCTVEGRWFRASLDLSAVRALLLDAPSQDGIRDEIVQQARRATGASDRLILIDGSQQAGTLAPRSLAALTSSAAPAALRLAVGDQAVQTPSQRVRAVVLSPVLRAPGWSGGTEDPLMWIGLTDGSLLRCRPTLALDADDGGLLPLACGESLMVPPGAELLTAIDLLAPVVPSAGLLAREPPLRFRQVPFFGSPMPLVRWHAELESLEVAAKRYPNGLAMRSAARAVYATGGAARLFASVAVADPPQPLAGAMIEGAWPWSGTQLAANPGARFSVSIVGPSGDMAERWRSPIVRPGDAPLAVEVPLAGAAALVLAVDPADAGDVADVGVWLDALLVHRE